MTATIHSFEEAFERKHSLKALLQPAYDLPPLSEEEIDRIMENVRKLLEERDG